MTKVYIMRGVPGSGKSRWVRENLSDALVVSCDRYFTEDGVYKFDPTKLAENHNKCLREFIRLVDGSPLTGPMMRPIVVDNTNTKLFEITPYYRIAEAFGCDVQIVRIITSPSICKQRNVHNVPPATIDAMFVGAEPLPPWWNVVTVMNDEW